MFSITLKLCSGSSSANDSGLGLGSEEVGMQKFPYIVPLIVVCMASWVSQGAAQDKKLEKIRMATAGLKGDFSRASIFDFSAQPRRAKKWRFENRLCCLCSV